jgi:hypothetical protein
MRWHQDGTKMVVQYLAKNICGTVGAPRNRSRGTLLQSHFATTARRTLFFGVFCSHISHGIEIIVMYCIVAM